MASSTALTLVNRVLSVTGDSKALATIAGSPGGIGERIVEFINLVIGEVEKKTNWPFLRSDSIGVGDGVNDAFVFTGTDDIRFGGAVSVWIANNGTARELTPEQFDVILSTPTAVTQTSSSTTEYYFQRGVDATTGKLFVQLYPVPPAGAVIHLSGFRKATRLTTTTTSTTEFDDDILIYGALMHMDAYDGMNRGYATLYAEHLAEYVMEQYANRSIQITTESYQ